MWPPRVTATGPTAPEDNARMNAWNHLIDLWCQLPLVWRASLLAVVGLLGAQQINRAIDRLAYRPRGRDPWLPAPEGLPSRKWSDRLPLWGWWSLRRESSFHGRWFWLRPLLIELLFPVAVAGLYLFEVRGGLYPVHGPVASVDVLHAQFALHALLIALMTVATFIDFDEQTIPDEVTLLGTVAGLSWVSLLPVSLLPTIVSVGYVPYAHHVVLTTATYQPEWKAGLGGPQSWPPWCDTSSALVVALVCIFAWWLAALPKVWTMRRGIGRAFQFAAASVVRYRTWRLPSFSALVMAMVALIAYGRGGWYWQACFSSVIGMVAAGGFTWTIRLVASHALATEALGFGDVTLMAMIGAFLGWQTSLLVFGLAPMTALLIAVLQWILTRRHDIAFGPYLCLAAVVWIVAWQRLWYGWAVTAFAMGWILLAVLALSVIMLGTLLWIWQMIKSLAGGR